MLLGHWFLVDPQLPRWALQRLDVAAGLGLAADLVVVASLGAFGADDGVMIGAMTAVSVMTALLIAAVWFSLKERAYSGVMAATGLSYLGVLTAFGVVVIGRLLVAGL
jgi:MFS superfamily sulfate permease-like transporter